MGLGFLMGSVVRIGWRCDLARTVFLGLAGLRGQHVHLDVADAAGQVTQD
jgi:hypothetical protein